MTHWNCGCDPACGQWHGCRECCSDFALIDDLGEAVRELVDAAVSAAHDLAGPGAGRARREAWEAYGKARDAIERRLRDHPAER